jgi:carbamoyl-phosphate synthase small subunit
MTKTGKLILEDGTEMTGKVFGYSGNIAGEVVFNTAMTGYPESLTDPSYRGQILVATFPLIGNYGVPNKDSENTLLTNYESDKIQVSGLIISNYSQEFSHWNAERSLNDWMIENKIPGLYDIDTRTLTKIIREKGVLLGKIKVNEDPIDFHDPNENNLVAEVSIPQPQVYGKGKYRILLVDYDFYDHISTYRCQHQMLKP